MCTVYVSESETSILENSLNVGVLFQEVHVIVNAFIIYKDQ